jgi:hypothetical protein
MRLPRLLWFAMGNTKQEPRRANVLPIIELYQSYGIGVGAALSEFSNMPSRESSEIRTFELQSE